MLLLAASLVSCEKESDDPAPDKTPIKFGKVETRASVNSVDEEDDMKESGFGVFGFVEGVENPLLLANEKVYWDKSLWTYNNTRYWIPDREFHFFAYYPYFDGKTEGSITRVAANDNGEIGYQLTFVTPETAKFDLLTAYTTVDTGADDFNASNPVSLAFTHALVNVNLNIWRDDVNHNSDQMRIIHVTLGNMRKSGTYSSDKDKWEPTNEKITLEKTYDKFSDSDNIGSAIVNTDGTLTPGVYDPAKPFTDQLLIPQTIDASNKVSLKICYQLWRDTGDDTDPNATKKWEDAELEAYLPYGTWEPNRRYTYNVVLSSVKDITFYYIQTKISPWGAPQVGGTIIIK